MLHLVVLVCSFWCTCKVEETVECDALKKYSGAPWRGCGSSFEMLKCFCLFSVTTSQMRVDQKVARGYQETSKTTPDLNLAAFLVEVVSLCSNTVLRQSFSQSLEVPLCRQIKHDLQWPSWTASKWTINSSYTFGTTEKTHGSHNFEKKKKKSSIAQSITACATVVITCTECSPSWHYIKTLP